MSNTEQDNNQQLRTLIAESGLSQPKALEQFNIGQARPLALSTWKAYLSNKDSVRYRDCPDNVLSHARKVLIPINEIKTEK